MGLSLRGRCASKATAKHGSWRSRLRRHAVPLSKTQTDILRLLAANRDPESYVAGASALNRDAPRYSGDIDVFHGREERAASAAAADAQTLEAAGYAVKWVRREPAIYTAQVTGPSGATHLEWVVD